MSSSNKFPRPAGTELPEDSVKGLESRHLWLSEAFDNISFSRGLALSLSSEALHLHAAPKRARIEA